VIDEGLALPQRALQALRALNFEQRVAAGAALLLIVSTFGPFSFVEAAEVLLALGVLALLFARGEGQRFHLPFGDGTIIAAAGVWAAALIVARLFERSLGQNLLALACAAVLFLAGARERAKRPPDDLPDVEWETPAERREPRERRRPRRERAAPGAAAADETETEPLPPPEFEPYRPEAGEQLRLGPEDEPEDDEATDEDETRPLPPTTGVEPQSAAGRRGRRRRPRP
jgi:hypothetical protein